MKTALAISPHLDDAVFSAGGLLARLTRAGWRVVVATVFTASVPNPEGFALACQLDKGLSPEVDYMALRREEDAAACAILGVEPIWLPFQEAPHRGYDSAPALFEGLREDDDIVDRIAPAITRLAEQIAPNILLGPQAIGAHADHVAVFSAGVRCALPMSLWVDFPYSTRAAPRRSPFEKELAACPTQVASLSSNEVAAKVGAATAYASQLNFQFGDLAAAEALIRLDGAVERFATRR